MATAVSGTARFPGTADIYRGDEASPWQTGLPTYSTLTYANLYPGSDPTLIYSIYLGGNAGGKDLFVTKMNAAGTAVLYTTIIGGSGSKVWLTVMTTSSNLPTINAFQTCRRYRHQFYLDIGCYYGYFRIGKRPFTYKTIVCR